MMPEVSFLKNKIKLFLASPLVGFCEDQCFVNILDCNIWKEKMN